MRRRLLLFSTAILLLSLTAASGGFALTATELNTSSSDSNQPLNAAFKPETKRSSMHAQDTKPFSTIAIGVKASSLGLGVETATPLSRRSNLRFGFNIFSYDRSFDRDGIAYAGRLQLRSAQALLDFFPVRGFHLSPGVLLYNGNELRADASVAGGRTFDLGNATFRSDPANPLTGTGKLAFNKAAPMLLLGFGNLVPRTRHFSFTVDLGVAYHGSPRATLDLAGNACDVNGLVCRNIAADANLQTNLQAEVTKLNNSASPYKFWPVVSMGFGYKF